jgi:hypothetical protein
VYDVNADYGYCDHEVKSAFNGYLTYDLPNGHGKQFQNKAPTGGARRRPTRLSNGDPRNYTTLTKETRFPC